MEKKKSLCIILLSITLVLVGVQIANVTGTVVHEAITNKDSFLDSKPIHLNVVDPYFNVTGPLEDPVWFWLNLTTVAIITPALFIVPTILLRDKKDEEVDDDPKTAIATENNLVARMGWLTIFIQNIVILVLVILFLVLIPALLNPQAQLNILKTYFILFNIDFIGAALLIAGIIVLSLKLPKQKISAYLGAAFWLIFIGTAIYPRIQMVSLVNAIGDFDINGLGNFFIEFTGVFVFLQTLGHCFFALGIYYTAKFLFANSQIRGTGLVNAFGITNYVVGSLGTLIMSTLVTYGNQIEIGAGSSLTVLYLILFFIKYLGVPIIGIIAGIMAFNHMKPQKA